MHEAMNLPKPLRWRVAKSKRDDVNKKVASLKRERNDAQAKAKALFMEANAIQDATPRKKGDTTPEPEWAKERLQQRLDALDLSLQTNWGTHVDERTTLNEMKNLIREHEEWVDSRKEKFSEINRMKELREDAKKLLETADKAHQAMVQLHDENQIFHDTYIENEEKRRHADARTTRLAQALDQSQRGIDFWKNCLEDGFHELLAEAERVREGGKSSRALGENGINNKTRRVRKSDGLFENRPHGRATRTLVISLSSSYRRPRNS